MFHIRFFPNLTPWIRWSVGAFCIVFYALVQNKKSNKVYFPYHYAWFSTFNVLIAAVIVHSGLSTLFMKHLPHDPESFESLGYAFIEFINHLFLGVVLITALSFAFTKSTTT